MFAMLERGGFVLAAILALSVAGWAVVVRAILRLRRVQSAAHAVPAAGSNPAPSMAETHARMSRNALERTLRRPLRVIAAVSASLPLLGLLGTVLGMIRTFQSLTAAGAEHSEGLAAGISVALITTQAGLVTALPLVVAHRWVRGRTDRALVDARR